MVSLEIFVLRCRPGNVSVIPLCHLSNVTEFPGEMYLASINYTHPVWVDVLVLVGALCGFRIAGYIILRYFRRPELKT